MYCAKCGREMRETGVFCPECLAGMEAYPVKPGTPIQLPVRANDPIPKKRKRRPNIKPEERIRQLRTALRWMTLALIITLIAFVVIAIFTLKLLQ